MCLLCQSTHILRCHQVGNQMVEVLFAGFVCVVKFVAVALTELDEDGVGVVLFAALPTVYDDSGQCRSFFWGYAT